MFESIPKLSVSYAQASEITSFSKSTLRSMAKDGLIPTVKIGRRVVIPYDALMRLVGFGAVAAKSSPAESAGAR